MIIQVSYPIIGSSDVNKLAIALAGKTISRWEHEKITFTDGSILTYHSAVFYDDIETEYTFQTPQ